MLYTSLTKKLQKHIKTCQNKVKKGRQTVGGVCIKEGRDAAVFTEDATECIASKASSVNDSRGGNYGPFFTTHRGRKVNLHVGKGRLCLP